MDKYFLCLLVLHGFCNFISDCIPSNFVASMCSICLWKQGRTKKVHRKVHRNWITNFGWHFVLHAGTIGYAMIVAPGVTVTFTCTGPGDQSAVEPTWFVNGKFTVTDGGCYRSILRRAEGLIYTATLMINGNRTCDTFIIYCRIYRDSQFLYLHNATLTFQGILLHTVV